MPFKAMRDEDFFSAAVQHLYLYDDITAASVTALKQQIRAANQDSLVNDGGWMLQDIVHHTAVSLDAVRAILRERTRLPATKASKATKGK